MEYLSDASLSEIIIRNPLLQTPSQEWVTDSLARGYVADNSLIGKCSGWP